jgi:8-amino-3,8-dideoxy-alpha-D-manno-octulosonate transaminase
MLGTPAKLEEITKICKERGIYLIEDTAWGCGGNLNGKSLGTWGQIGTFSFDFAKTMTTGEGGMLVFKNKEIYEKAAAWHDHGHENNPAVPRWEDTRSSSGFNYRMMELQGAIGLAQLRKLPNVIKAQRQNRDLIWSAISDIPGISPREMPSGSYDTADALVFFVKDVIHAKKCREALLHEGLGTKILPEAYSWHFASTWNHMPELVDGREGDLCNRFSKSNDILSTAVALPISVKQAKDIPQKIKGALTKALI